MSAKVAVIQGSGRGIGLHLARQYLNNTQLQVVALSRNSAEARKAILDGGGSDDRLHTLDVDVREENTIAKAAETVKGRFGDDSLRLLFNVSGILRTEKNLGQLDYGQLLDSFKINSFGHLLSFKHFVPLVPKKAQKKDNEAQADSDPAQGLIPEGLSVLASMSARVGSIGDNGRGGWYSYRSSKASLNQMVRTLSHELKLRNLPALAVALHPGTVRTDLSKNFTGPPGSEKPLGDGQFEAPQAAENLVNVIKNLSKEENGAFRDWKNEDVPW